MEEFIRKTIERAKLSISQELSKVSNKRSADRSKLDILREALDQLLESDLSDNDSIRLLSRQLNRFMNHDKQSKFCIDLYDYLLYILKKPNGKHDVSGNSRHFHKMLNYEKELELRELQYHQTIPSQKMLYEFIDEHKVFLQKYLQQCICLHSQIEISSLLDNINDFLYNNYGLQYMSLSEKIQQNLKDKLKYFRISLDFSNRELFKRSSLFSTDMNSNKPINDRLNTFLTSAELKTFGAGPDINHVLKSYRWIVILGDPGDAKTTLLRSITRMYAEAMLIDAKDIRLTENKDSIIRVPILIRIGEFASWLKQNPTRKLMNYIGKHTWFSRRYCDNENEYVWKELIYNGHALILLDGLDEISHVQERREIVKIVHEFIDQYVKDPYFVSAFDEQLYGTNSYATQSPSKPGGNQIIITSRIIGYDMNPLVGTFIEHYVLKMDDKEAKEFAQKWMSQVEKFVDEILLNEQISLDQQTMKILSEKRRNTLESMFEKCSDRFLLNPSLLNLLCTIIFRSSNEFEPKSRVEIYDRIVQSALRSWRNYEPTISEDSFMNFLINLSTYIHLESSSGLIDTFDITRFARLTLKQHNVYNNRAELHESADELIKALESCMGIVAERGLDVYGFEHLSFQEYFFARSLINQNKTTYNFINNIGHRLILHSTNFRFYESIHLALGWISWKWALDDYEKLCQYLVTSNENYTIPLGTLLLFDVYNDLVKLPSESILFTALDNILFHPIDTVVQQCLILNLFKLPDEIIKTWMSTSHFKDEKSLFRFCQCFLIQCKTSRDKHSLDFVEEKISVICQQLFTIRNENASIESIIDQTIRRIMSTSFASHAIINRNLRFDFEQHKIDESNIHPLILSVLIVVSGGITFRNVWLEEICWSSEFICRDSSVIKPILKYLMNNEESDLIQIEKLVEQFENTINEVEQSNTSIEIIDTFIALICLKGFSNVFIIRKYHQYEALTMAFQQIKRAASILKVFFTNERLDYYAHDEYSFRSIVISIIKMFFSQFHQDAQLHETYSKTYRNTLDQLEIKWTSYLFNPSNPQSPDNDKYVQSQLKFSHFTENLIEQSPQNSDDEFFLFLSLIPESLQQFYYYLFLDPNNKTDSLPPVILLVQCLISLEDLDIHHPKFVHLLTKLQFKCEEYMLENYLLVLRSNNNFEELIEIEYQRIHHANQIKRNDERNWKLFAAFSSLIRLFQIEKHSKRNITSSLLNTITNIIDPILQIIIFSVILNKKDSLDLDENQVNQFELKIISLLKCFSPYLSLLTLTFLVLQYHRREEIVSILFPKLLHIIGNQLKENPVRQAVLIALQQNLNDSIAPEHLSYSFEFNSSLLFQYFTNTQSFHPTSIPVLSLLYLRELAFDVHHLQFYLNVDFKENIFPPEELKQPSNDENIMTYTKAISITNYMLQSGKHNLPRVIEDVACCWVIEDEAWPIIKTWLQYRHDEDFKFFAHYVALQLFIKHSDVPDLVKIIHEMFCIGHIFHGNLFLEEIFNSDDIDSLTFQQIVQIAYENLQSFSGIDIWIDRKETLELLLQLEHDRILENKKKNLSQIRTKSFLSMISGCSRELQIYLKDHLHSIITEQSENISPEEYAATVMKWIVEIQMANSNNNIFSRELYEYVFTYLHDRSFPQIQKAVLLGLYSVFSHTLEESHVFFNIAVVDHFERIILSNNFYSDNILALCLLVYGNHLRQLQLDEIDYNVSDEIQLSLTELSSSTSSSEMLIPIRAGFCLIFAKKWSMDSISMSNVFGNKWEMTIEKEYNILLQQTLYERYYRYRENIIHFISIHSTEILETFVTELKNSLENRSYLSDPLPDYIEIANQFTKDNLDKFKNAMQKISMNETVLMTSLYKYFYYAKEEYECKNIIKLYGRFGIITNEWVKMLEMTDVTVDVDDNYTVFDRAVVEELLGKLEWIMCYTKHDLGFIVFEILIKLANAHIVSIFEIHQRISIMVKKFSANNNFPSRFRHDEISHLLSNLSCIEKIPRNSIEPKLLRENDIDKQFEREVERLKQLKLS
ncbi:unnamed protein product [Adineta ricciae]|nr:unnamed protein product [Adineta ricciae]